MLRASARVMGDSKPCNLFPLAKPPNAGMPGMPGMPGISTLIPEDLAALIACLAPRAPRPMPPRTSGHMLKMEDWEDEDSVLVEREVDKGSERLEVEGLGGRSACIGKGEASG
mmetsp:Transcript_78973/g.139399  ORF Transcript_78973/g.139399 Transcript_78973/m.139399 type:complete len:113 (-) Transcript_78973:19-357(-)